MILLIGKYQSALTEVPALNLLSLIHPVHILYSNQLDQDQSRELQESKQN